MPTDVAARELVGRGVSAGLVCAPVLRLVPTAATHPGDGPDTGTPEERLSRIVAALDAVAHDMEARVAGAPPAAVEVLQMTAELARDPALASAAESHLRSGCSAEGALDAAVEDFCAQLDALGGYLAERVSDLRDVRDRATAHLRGDAQPVVPSPGYPYILAARDLSPADTATLGESDVVGILTEEGGPTSHTAILARSLGLPAVVACDRAAAIPDGTVVVLDGSTGLVELEPDEERREAVRRELAAPARPTATGPGRTRDGHPVGLLANIGTVADAERAASYDGEGVGLFRTEFLFLNRADRPDVAEQTAIYTRVFELFGGRPVTVRTLDAGSDKPIAFLQLQPEENPALGVRGIRLATTDRAHLVDQLTALGHAQRATAVRLKVMAPMVSTAEEARDFVLTARAAGLTEVGVMVEVPAAALRATDLLAEVDFVSIGTNDLSQYTFAADRMVSGLGNLLDPWQPALLDLVATVGSAAQAVAKPVGVCGEAAADPLFAAVLVGLGITSLSMAAPALQGVRDQLAVLPRSLCQEMASAARQATSAGAAREAALGLAESVRRLADA
ncbi:phosphoenolpyruvate--protein phosphotransferase [Nocardioides pocheonensis]|uniref:Phosphoenolpyruvate-protein phosphotransferase n=1 Tax=Nocardioides pocheonensis TaxID=661485 RepID=A0A3N0GY96_9ACTN|nr:phosphoenolpyruvate--protein phosphotransferase [Nocardioides pocheonensis]RNM17379.1 phosphoenolpyruvate--protein phosphotransferase [Nocardioides pocheonensis]